MHIYQLNLHRSLFKSNRQRQNSLIDLDRPVDATYSITFLKGPLRVTNDRHALCAYHENRNGNCLAAERH